MNLESIFQILFALWSFLLLALITKNFMTVSTFRSSLRRTDVLSWIVLFVIFLISVTNNLFHKPPPEGMSIYNIYIYTILFMILLYFTEKYCSDWYKIHNKLSKKRKGLKNE
jgi:hypothetical protein